MRQSALRVWPESLGRFRGGHCLCRLTSRYASWFLTEITLRRARFRRRTLSKLFIFWTFMALILYDAHIMVGLVITFNPIQLPLRYSDPAPFNQRKMPDGRRRISLLIVANPVASSRAKHIKDSNVCSSIHQWNHIQKKEPGSSIT